MLGWGDTSKHPETSGQSLAIIKAHVWFFIWIFLPDNVFGYIGKMCWVLISRAIILAGDTEHMLHFVGCSHIALCYCDMFYTSPSEVISSTLHVASIRIGICEMQLECGCEYIVNNCCSCFSCCCAGGGKLPPCPSQGVGGGAASLGETQNFVPGHCVILSVSVLWGTASCILKWNLAAEPCLPLGRVW